MKIIIMIIIIIFLFCSSFKSLRCIIHAGNSITVFDHLAVLFAILILGNYPVNWGYQQFNKPLTLIVIYDVAIIFFFIFEGEKLKVVFKEEQHKIQKSKEKRFPVILDISLLLLLFTYVRSLNITLLLASRYRK